MTFVINAIQQSLDQQHSVEFLVGVDSPLFARKFLEKPGLVLLSLKDFMGEESRYATSYVDIVFEQSTIRCYASKHLPLKDFCYLFVSLGFEIVTVNSLEVPLTEQQALAVIADAKQLLVVELAKKAELQKQSDLQERKVFYDSHALDKAKEVINWLVDKMDSLLQQQAGYISARDVKLIRDRLEEVKKQRMGTNFDKIRDLLNELFVIFARFEEEYFSSQEETAQPLFSGTTVTTVDLEKQLHTLDRVIHQQMFGGTIPNQEKDYVAFGKGLFYLYFLKKDFLASLASFSHFLYHIFDLIQYFVIFVLCALGVSFLVVSPTSFSSLSYACISFGFLGALAYIFSFFKKNHILLMIVLLFLYVTTYFLLLPKLYITFSL